MYAYSALQRAVWQPAVTGEGCLVRAMYTPACSQQSLREAALACMYYLARSQQSLERAEVKKRTHTRRQSMVVEAVTGEGCLWTPACAAGMCGSQQSPERAQHVCILQSADRRGSSAVTKEAA
jgi:hydroxyethylthiazole kinase-like sugar kinase family protein